VAWKPLCYIFTLLPENVYALYLLKVSGFLEKMRINIEKYGNEKVGTLRLI
jgi:hypothetical protein